MTDRKRTTEEIMRDAKRLKSQSKYDKAWDEFLMYHKNPNVSNMTEEMFLQYFDYLINHKNYVFSTLWSVFSMLNSESQTRCGPKLNDYFKLISLIKSKERGYCPKQGSTYTKDNVETFLQNAPFTGIYVLHKAALVLSVYGGLRGTELTDLTIEDLEKCPDCGFWVNYNVSKQIQGKVKNRFNVPSNHGCYITGYLDCLDDDNGRFFRKFIPANKGDKTVGKYVKSPMGKNMIAKIPSEIATYLKLPNAATFTGHSFRRTAATLFANAGATSVDLKQHMNWKSDAVVMRYVNQSEVQKRNMSSLISHGMPISQNNSHKQELMQKTVHITGCTNCVINI